MLMAAGQSIAPSVVALVGVALTAVVTLVTTWRWPTLRRRTQDHVALLKDLPLEAGAELRHLVADELRLLAERDRGRLDPGSQALLYASRGLSALTVISGLGVLLAAFTVASGEAADGDLVAVLALITTILAGANIAASTWLYIRSTRRIERARAAGR
jgi:hypothetical protein